MNDQGAFATYMDSKALGSFVDTELEVWADIIKAKNIKAD